MCVVGIGCCDLLFCSQQDFGDITPALCPVCSSFRALLSGLQPSWLLLLHIAIAWGMSKKKKYCCPTHGHWNLVKA